MFQGLDFYNIDPLLNEEERMVRDTIRQFVSDKVIPIIEKHNREATFPIHLVPQLAELGVLGANIQHQWLWMRGIEQCCIRLDHARVGAR